LVALDVAHSLVLPTQLGDVTAMGWAWSLWLLRPVHRALCAGLLERNFTGELLFASGVGKSGSAGLARNSGGTECLGSRKARLRTTMRWAWSQGHSVDHSAQQLSGAALQKDRRPASDAVRDEMGNFFSEIPRAWPPARIGPRRVKGRSDREEGLRCDREFSTSIRSSFQKFRFFRRYLRPRRSVEKLSNKCATFFKTTQVAIWKEMPRRLATYPYSGRGTCLLWRVKSVTWKIPSVLARRTSSVCRMTRQSSPPRPHDCGTSMIDGKESSGSAMAKGCLSRLRGSDHRRSR
jgi:hypothetical protein